MKGTLFSADFVKDSNGNLRLLELNTDTAFTNGALHHVDFTQFIDLLENNSIKEFYVIYKSVHRNFVDALSAAIYDSGKVEKFSKILEDSYNIYPTVVEDDVSKFILRCAYDESAIFDSVYCNQNENIYKLFYDNDDTNSIAEFCITSTGFNGDCLNRTYNSDFAPDIAVKDISDTHSQIKFYKIPKLETVEESFSNFIESVGDNKLITNYYINDNEPIQKSYRSFNIIYGNNLNVINLVDVEVESVFEKPENLKFDDSVLNLIDEKHYYEFATNYPQFVKYNSYGGIFEEEQISDINSNPVLVSDVNIGESYKSVYIDGSPDTDDPRIFMEWSHEGSSLPEGSFVTSSILINKVKTPLIKKLISHITTSDGFSFRSSANQHLLVYDSILNQIRYKEIVDINEQTDYLIKSNGDTSAIISNDIEILEDTHYVYNLDFEEVDTFLLHGGDYNIKIVSHNACFPAGTKIKINDTEFVNIENIHPGDTIVSFDFHNKKLTTGRVGTINNSFQNELIHISAENNLELKVTPNHVINANGKWVFAKELKVGDRLFDDTLTERNILNIEIIEGEVEVYHIVNVGNDHTYFANDILVHNFSIFGGSCFIAGTKITMEDGSEKNIEDVVIGDEVLSYNEEKRCIEPKKVIKLNSPIHDDLVEYTLSNGIKITSTFDHPFYVNGLNLASYQPNWTNERYDLPSEVGKIKVGDFVNLSNKEKAEIISIIELDRVFTQTYIISVEDNRNFYANNVLVHNK